MTLQDLVAPIDGFAGWSHADKIKLFAWFLHTHEARTHFTPAQIGSCYDRLHAAPPSSVSPFLGAMEKRKPKEALRDASGYRLESRIRAELDTRFGQRAATVHVHKLLNELPAKIPAIAEREYLQEALICFRHRAFRAAIVMCWNLAYDHLCEHVLAKGATGFNAQFPKSHPNAKFTPISARGDFGSVKESEVLKVCKSANYISDSLFKVLDEKLKRRNIAAHPSGVHISEATAEEFIKDLVENVVLKLA